MKKYFIYSLIYLYFYEGAYDSYVENILKWWGPSCNIPCKKWGGLNYHWAIRMQSRRKRRVQRCAGKCVTSSKQHVICSICLLLWYINATPWPITNYLINFKLHYHWMQDWEEVYMISSAELIAAVYRTTLETSEVQSIKCGGWWNAVDDGRILVYKSKISSLGK